jgi:hypothetical protein
MVKTQPTYIYLGVAILVAVVVLFTLFSGGRTGKFYSSPLSVQAGTQPASSAQAGLVGTTPEVCYDGRDNDGDGRLDCLDPDCNGQVFNLNKGWKCEFGKELTCNDNADNDFDGKIDCNDQDCMVQFYADNDRDFYGDPNKPTVVNCKTAFMNLMSTDSTDCNDNNMWVNPGMAEACNGVDDNCDGRTDEAFDADKDGYPDKNNANCAGLPNGKLDCNDNDPTINPSGTDICDDGICGLCSDTDGGKNINFGTCTGTNGSLTDFCTFWSGANQQYIVEQYCLANGECGSDYRGFDCFAIGKVCKNGACV